VREGEGISRNIYIYTHTHTHTHTHEKEKQQNIVLSGGTTVCSCSWMDVCGVFVDGCLWCVRGWMSVVCSWMDVCGVFVDGCLWCVRGWMSVVCSWMDVFFRRVCLKSQNSNTRKHVKTQTF